MALYQASCSHRRSHGGASHHGVCFRFLSSGVARSDQSLRQFLPHAISTQERCKSPPADEGFAASHEARSVDQGGKRRPKGKRYQGLIAVLDNTYRQ